MSYSPALKRYTKDAGETLDYRIDWSALLEGLDVVSAVHTVKDKSGVESPALLVIDQALIMLDKVSTQLLISAGTDGIVYRVQSAVTDNSVPPRVFVRSIEIALADR